MKKILGLLSEIRTGIKKAAEWLDGKPKKRVRPVITLKDGILRVAYAGKDTYKIILRHGTHEQFKSINMEDNEIVYVEDRKEYYRSHDRGTIVGATLLFKE